MLPQTGPKKDARRMGFIREEIKRIAKDRGRRGGKPKTHFAR
jgi:hypothetical protein